MTIDREALAQRTIATMLTDADCVTVRGLMDQSEYLGQRHAKTILARFVTIGWLDARRIATDSTLVGYYPTDDGTRRFDFVRDSVDPG